MDRTLAGVALMVGFTATAPLMDVFSKLAAETIPPAQVATARFLVQGLAVLPFALLAGLRLPRELIGAMLLRGGLLAVSTFTFVLALREMPIADALAIVFVMPFLLLLLGRVLMGDQVGPRRIAACAVGFGGSLLVIRPALDSYGWTALWPLATALAFALYMLLTRSLSTRLGAAAMQLHSSAAAVLLCVPVLLLAEGSGSAALDPVWPEGWAWAWLLGVGLLSAVSHGMMTVALRLAPSATLAPLNYLEIVTAVALGYLVFGDFPDAMTWAGIGVIVASGLYVIHRERLASAARRGAPGPRPPVTRAAG